MPRLHALVAVVRADCFAQSIAYFPIVRILSARHCSCVLLCVMSEVWRLRLPLHPPLSGIQTKYFSCPLSVTERGVVSAPRSPLVSMLLLESIVAVRDGAFLSVSSCVASCLSLLFECS